MKNNKGITMIALVITIIVLGILASITINVSTRQIKEARLQDIVTNMLLIQAKAKQGIEEVVFKTANLEDEDEINQIKTANLIGIKYGEGDEDIGLPDEINLNDDEWYYLDGETLNQIGLSNLYDGEYFYLYKYDTNLNNIEIIYTKGYLHTDNEIYYTLSDLEELQNS